MQMSSSNQHTSSGLIARGWVKVKAMPKGLKEKVFNFYRTAKEIQQDDPRRVIHALKVGLTLTLVSLFYYHQPLYDSFGLSAMWAVMTVVVVFEYSVGATLGKGLNRGLATLLAGALGVGAHYLADLSGQTIEPILIGFFVFLQAAIATFIRFFPKIKARYDYGLLIFILTFSLISVSGFREDEIIEMAHKRLSTIFIGGSACVMISIFVCPVWAGEELHSLIALNLESLANFLQAFEDEYFRTSKEGESKDVMTALLEGYKTVLNSKSTEESLANFARWEPRHGRFQFRHPWDKYLKIGTLTRQCAYRMEALNAQLNSNLQASAEIRSIIQEVCSEMSLESGKALKELGMAMSTMRKPCFVDIHIANSKSAAKSLNSLLQSSLWKEIDLLSILPAGTVASLLCDIIACIEEIAAVVNELPSLTNFETIDTTKSPSKIQSTPHSDSNSDVVILVEDLTISDLPKSKSLSDQHNTNRV
ncbi:aluminum-activated malate transporter 2-like [Prosopis cineraria]|uniref:aluminum-activated malate transporter 2-like n=1 Tax=Prosopis cineraria TaxID=364024 RepID=UPI0024105221|nr:aluminum-activated malate transporter 2-like [Prosopis cineraria]